jgi:hypothetical protein
MAHEVVGHMLLMEVIPGVRRTRAFTEPLVNGFVEFVMDDDELRPLAYASIRRALLALRRQEDGQSEAFLYDVVYKAIQKSREMADPALRQDVWRFLFALDIRHMEDVGANFDVLRRMMGGFGAPASEVEDRTTLKFPAAILTVGAALRGIEDAQAVKDVLEREPNLTVAFVAESKADAKRQTDLLKAVMEGNPALAKRFLVMDGSKLKVGASYDLRLAVRRLPKGLVSVRVLVGQEGKSQWIGWEDLKYVFPVLVPGLSLVKSLEEGLRVRDAANRAAERSA